MPKGDPAGYLPKVKAKRRAAGGLREAPAQPAARFRPVKPKRGSK